jgi:ParB family chromosome partitioning protein
LRVLKLPKDIQKGLFEGKISEGHARALLSVEDANAQMLLYLESIKKGYSVREIEDRAKSVTGPAKKVAGRSKGKAKDPEILKLEEELRLVLGTKVSVQNNRKNKGKLIIEYYSLDDLDRILEAIRKKK